VVARLSPETTLEAANAQLRSVVEGLIASGDLGEHKQLAARSLHGYLTASGRPALALLSAFAGLLLLLAGINVGALLLVRMAARGPELQVRLALGAGLRQLRQQLLGEALLLGLLAGLLGSVLAWLAFAVVQQQAADLLPRLASTRPGWSMLAFALLLGMLLSAVLSLLAAQQVLRPRRLGRSRAVGVLSHRVLGTLIAAEVGLAVLLLCGSALLWRSLITLQHVPLGFDPQQALTAELVLPDARYGQPARQSAAISAIVAALQQTPGVTEAAFVVGLPLVASGTVSHSFLLEHQPGGDQRSVSFRPFHGDYFSAAGIAVLSGRGFDDSDDADGEAVAWVNVAFVKRWLGQLPPLGQRIAWVPGEAGPAERGPRWLRIVGVVGDTRSSKLRETDAAAVYLPYLQREDNWIRFGQLLVRTQTAAVPASALQSAVSSVDPDIVLPTVRSWSERVAQATRSERLNLLLAGSFALIALLLGLQGMIGMVAYSIAQRREEMALRLALGATTGRLQRESLQHGLLRVCLGLICGVLLSLVLARLAHQLLYGVSSSDPWSYASVAVLTLCAGAIACWWPTRTLGQIQPAMVLKSQ
jgi:putative ABC transport system permease protein